METTALDELAEAALAYRSARARLTAAIAGLTGDAQPANEPKFPMSPAKLGVRGPDSASAKIRDFLRRRPWSTSGEVRAAMPQSAQKSVGYFLHTYCTHRGRPGTYRYTLKAEYAQ